MAKLVRITIGFSSEMFKVVECEATLEAVTSLAKQYTKAISFKKGNITVNRKNLSDLFPAKAVRAQKLGTITRASIKAARSNRLTENRVYSAVFGIMSKLCSAYDATDTKRSSVAIGNMYTEMNKRFPNMDRRDVVATVLSVSADASQYGLSVPEELVSFLSSKIPMGLVKKVTEGNYQIPEAI